MPPTADKLDQAESLLRDLEVVETKLRAVQDGLTRSHRLTTLGTMASIIAHEFNNILTPIISYAQLAKANPDDKALCAKALERSLAGAEKAAHICNSILGFARAAEGGGTAIVADVLNEVFACLARDPARDGIKLQVDVPADLCVAMGPVDLQQVLLNLVLNARQAMSKQRGGTLTITATPRPRKGVILEVTDTGCGIADDILPRVFEPFVTRREMDDDASAPRGTGLGLAICRDLIHRAGGEITIARTGTTGTTFRITLPAAK